MNNYLILIISVWVIIVGSILFVLVWLPYETEVNACRQIIEAGNSTILFEEYECYRFNLSEGD